MCTDLTHVPSWFFKNRASPINVTFGVSQTAASQAVPLTCSLPLHHQRAPEAPTEISPPSGIWDA